jgi:hypothetical protein
LRWPTLSVIDRNQEPESRELHLEHLFIEHELRHFATQAVTEGNKKPDFYSPPQRHTTMLSFPENLRMLAVKTTCKDRWRQILNEADKIHQVHLFTLQEGCLRHSEMREAGVRLVVPSSLHKIPGSGQRGINDVRCVHCRAYRPLR